LKNFPKALQADKQAGGDSYPTYARPDNGRTAIRPHPNGRPGDTIQVTNQWVVPHNPALLLKYNCHINVEICCSIRSIKYMHKYVYKGHDQAQGVFVGGGGGGGPEPRTRLTHTCRAATSPLLRQFTESWRWICSVCTLLLTAFQFICPATR